MLLLILMPFIGLAPGQALPQSPVAMVNGRVMGLPNGNVASFQVIGQRRRPVCRSADSSAGRRIPSLFVRPLGGISRGGDRATRGIWQLS